MSNTGSNNDALRREIDVDKISVHPDQWYEDFLSLYDIPENAEKSTLNVPWFTHYFVKVKKKDVGSTKKVISSMVVYGLKTLTDTWNIGMNEIVVEDSSKKEEALENGRRNSNVTKYNPDRNYDVANKKMNIILDESIYSEIQDIKEILNCTRSLVMRVFMYISIYYCNVNTFNKDKYSDLFESKNIDRDIEEFREELEERIESLKEENGDG